MQITLTELHKRLLNDFQRDFPLTPSPYRALAEHLGVDEAAVLAAFAELDRQQLVSRIGAIIPPNHIGASTLVAMAIPPGQLQVVADRISAFPEVNHNYERENRFNLWFVAAASSAGQLQTVLAAIEQATGFAALRLPLVDDFFIDLGFPLDFCQSGNTPPTVGLSNPPVARQTQYKPDAQDLALLAQIADGLPLCPRPYAQLGLQISMDEAEVIHRLTVLKAQGLIKRLGVIVKHRPLGYRANAMVVWDVPDTQVKQLGGQISQFSFVTLCYQRPRHAEWPYNLYCMIHGKDRATVLAQLAQLSQACGLGGFARQVLFSRRCFKQRGAVYQAPPTPVTANG
jgi:DNA-binding Lrp family transcriptional regulator